MQDVLDQAVLNELLSFTEEGDPELLLDLIHMFLDDSPSKVSAIDHGLESGNFDKVERAAHSLKGSSGNLGARQVQHLCDQLLSTTRNRELNQSKTVAKQLAAQFDQATAALKSVLSDYED